MVSFPSPIALSPLISTMMFLGVCWLFATFAICLGFLLVSARSFVPKVISNLYLFGKIRDLDNYKLPQKRTLIQVPKR